ASVLETVTVHRVGRRRADAERGSWIGGRRLALSEAPGRTHRRAVAIGPNQFWPSRSPGFATVVSRPRWAGRSLHHEVACSFSLACEGSRRVAADVRER